MFVVNTTSATVGASPDAANSPEKRVPSSRRRNPGVLLEERFTACSWFLGRRRGWLWSRRRGARIRRRRLRATRCRGRGVRRRGIRRRQTRNCVRATGRSVRRSRRAYGRRLERLVEDRLGRAAARRRDREQEREAEEQPAAPPACLCEQVT